MLCHLLLASVEDEKCSFRFTQAASWTKIEFARTRGKLEPFVQVKREAIANLEHKISLLITYQESCLTLQMEKRIMRLKGKGK